MNMATTPAATQGMVRATGAKIIAHANGERLRASRTWIAASAPAM